MYHCARACNQVDALLKSAAKLLEFASGDTAPLRTSLREIRERVPKLTQPAPKAAA